MKDCSPECIRIDDFTEELARSHKEMENCASEPTNAYGWVEVTARRLSLRRLGFLDQRFLAYDDHDSRIGDVKAALVGFHVIADLSAFRQRHVAVDDGAANARVAANVYVIVDDRIGD